MPRALKFFNPRLRDCVDEPRQNQVFHSFTTCLTNESDEKIESGVFQYMCVMSFYVKYNIRNVPTSFNKKSVKITKRKILACSAFHKKVKF